MKSEEAQKHIFDCLCLAFEVLGTKKGFSTQDLWKLVNSDDFRAKYGELTFGLVEASLRELMNDKKIQIYNGLYKATPKAFINWSDNKSSTVDTKDEKEWTPLEVENFEEVAAQIDEVAELLEKENGYMDKHHLEAEHTIEASKNLSASIRENTGTVYLSDLIISCH